MYCFIVVIKSHTNEPIFCNDLVSYALHPIFSMDVNMLIQMCKCVDYCIQISQ